MIAPLAPAMGGQIEWGVRAEHRSSSPEERVSMAEQGGLAIAGYLLAYTLIRKLEAKSLLTRLEAEELIAGAMRHLEAAGAPGDAAVKEAQAILQETLSVVQEQQPDESRSS